MNRSKFCKECPHRFLCEVLKLYKDCPNKGSSLCSNISDIGRKTFNTIIFIQKKRHFSEIKNI